MADPEASGVSSNDRLKARGVLFDLYGDFAVEGERDGSMWLGKVVRLGLDLGVSEMAVRSAAGRMVQEGWLTAERQGRESVYVLTPRARQVIEAGRRRTLTSLEAWWNGSWYVVALSVPEARRDVRDRMRKELAWLGFGSPSSALYISTHDYREEVVRVAEELNAVQYIQVYRAEALVPKDPRELVARAWENLSEVNRQYGEFVDRFAPQLARTRAQIESGSLADRAAFKLRFELTNQFRRSMIADPDLPLDLLPAAWNGVAARLLFREFHALVTPQAMRYFDEVLQTPAAAARTDEPVPLHRVSPTARPRRSRVSVA